MNNLLFYFLQVIVCSAILCLYYIVVLSNKKFHQYNRFYLLGAALVSWIIPFIKIPIATPIVTNNENISIPLYAVIASNNSSIEKIVQEKGSFFSFNTILILGYVVVCTVLFIGFVHALYKIFSLLKTHSYKQYNNVYLVLTKAKGTPFSFFKFIFWNTEIDLQTNTGKQILQHELTHIHEKHSTDKIILQLITIVGWLNPFFWYIKKEVYMIHEFIADNKTVANGDASALANMLLTAAYPKQNFALSNPFFYSPIKRRIAMLTNAQKTKFSYARRLIILPLLAIVIVLFAFRKKDVAITNISLETTINKVVDAVCSPLIPNKFNYVFTNTYKVVIDAGHGGHDKGAEANGCNEKTINLQVAQEIAKANTNKNVEIVLLRNEDVFQSPVQKVEMINKLNADAFVTIHCNNDASSKLNGLEVYLPSKKKTVIEESNLLASTIGKEAKSFTKFNGVKQRSVGIWVLDATPIPGVLVECGYLSNAEDAKQLQNKNYQQQLANKILSGIELYLWQMENKNNDILIDTTPAKKIDISKAEMSVTIKGYKEVYFPVKVEFVKDKSLSEQFENGTIYIVGNKSTANLLMAFNKNTLADLKLLSQLKLSNGNFVKDVIKLQLVKEDNIAINDIFLDTLKNNPLFVVNGLEIDSKNGLKKLDPGSIESVTVLKNTTAVTKYGEKAQNGVIEVQIKNDIQLTEKPIENYKEIVVHGYKLETKAYNKMKSKTTAPETNSFTPLNSKVISSVKWNAYLYKLSITLKNGIEETYYTNNPEHVKIIEERYGKLPKEYLPKMKETIIGKPISKNKIEIGATEGRIVNQHLIPPMVVKVPKKITTYTQMVDKYNLLVYLNNQKSSTTLLDNLAPKSIKHIEYLQSKNALEKFGEQGSQVLMNVITK